MNEARMSEVDMSELGMSELGMSEDGDTYLVEQILDLERLHDVSAELRMNVCVSNLFVQQLSHRRLTLRTDFLRLVRNVQFRHLRLA